MKRVFFTAVSLMILSSTVLYATNGKKPVAKKKAKTECCKKQNSCNTSSCPKSSCPKTACMMGN
ncbi:MAG: hypothetical protein ABI741_11780 [Ferruginibacter sp.]